MTTFAQLLRAHRAQRGMTFAQLAEEVGYHPSYLSLVERGLRLLDEEGVVRLARVLGIDPSKALLAALRERLPEDLRSLVPAEAAPAGVEQLHTVARQLQAEHFDFEVETLVVQATVDWDGNLHTVCSYDVCRPNAAGRPLWELSFRERVVGREPPEQNRPPKFAVKSIPGELEHELITSQMGVWQVNRLIFPRGWRRSPHRGEDAFSFAVETYQERAYLLDATSFAKQVLSESPSHPLRGFLAFHIPYFVHRLRLSLDFPGGYVPEKWEGWAWWGTTSMDAVTRNLCDRGVSRSFSLAFDDSRAEILVEEPLAGYSYALVWKPAERQQYLEARFRGRDDA